MGKIIRLKTEATTVVDALEYLLDKANAGELKSFVFAGKTHEEEIATSWAAADVGTRQELVSHLQVDVMYAIVAANMDRLIEEV